MIWENGRLFGGNSSRLVISSALLFMFSAFRLTRSSMVLPAVLFSALRCMLWDSCMRIWGSMERSSSTVNDPGTGFTRMILACYVLSPISVSGIIIAIDNTQ